MRLGFVGIGHMGRGMAANLAKKTTILNIFDVVPPTSEPFLDSSKFNICQSLVEVTKSCDIISLSLPSESVCHDVIFGKSGLLESWQQCQTNSRRIIVDHGSFSRTFAVTTGQILNRSNIGYVDAPVSGGPTGASQGTLSIMVGGHASDIDTISPLLQAMGKNIFHFGDIGSGMSAKLINQMLVTVHAQAACEALRLAELYNMSSIEQLQAMLDVSWGNSRMISHVFRDYEIEYAHAKNMKTQTAAPLRNLQKDMLCLTHDIPSATELPLFRETKLAVDETCGNGWHNSPFAALLLRLKNRDSKT